MWVIHAGQATAENASREQVLTAVQEAASAGTGEIWIEHEQDPMLAVVIGGGRAMVLRLAESGDAGYHAVDPAASPEPSEEYVLVNGQVDKVRRPRHDRGSLRHADRDPLPRDC